MLQIRGAQSPAQSQVGERDGQLGVPKAAEIGGLGRSLYPVPGLSSCLEESGNHLP